VWPAQRPVVGAEAGRRPVGRPAIAQPAGPPVLFRRQFGTCSLGVTGRASAPRGLRQGKANVRKDTERSVAAERSRHSRRSLPTLLHCRRCGHRSQTSDSGVIQQRIRDEARGSFHAPTVVPADDRIRRRVRCHPASALATRRWRLSRAISPAGTSAFRAFRSSGHKPITLPLPMQSGLLGPDADADARQLVRGITGAAYKR
jgi:hypothetical protein